MHKRRRTLSLYVGGFIVAGLLLMTLISFFYTPYDVTEMDIKHKFTPPSLEHPMGTDHFGRDVFSRVMKGAQTACFVGITAAGIGLIFGIIIGSFAGYFGGIIDELLMRLMDAMLSFPGILFALVFVAVFGGGIVNTVIALGIMSIPSFARISRSGVLQVKSLTYIDMARSVGVRSMRILFIHILPNIISPLIVATSVSVAGALLSEAGLSYLGLGVKPPDPSWGRMLSEGQAYLTKAPHAILGPGLMITLAVLGFNLLGDGIRDLTDPRE